MVIYSLCVLCAFVEKKIIHHRATEKHKEIINIKKICVLRASVVHFYHKDTEKHKEIINIKKTCVLRASVVHFYHKDTEKHK